MKQIQISAKSFRNGMQTAVLSALFLLMGITSAAGQDFQRTFDIAAGGTVRVHSVSGNVTVTAYDGASIVVVARKEGRDVEMVTIEDNSSENQVEVRDRYPQNCRRCNVSVHFEVKVPRRLAFKYDHFGSVSGNVEINGAMGQLTAKAVSGNVTVRAVEGAVNASSVSGDVHVMENSGSVSANSVSGNVEVDIKSLSNHGAMKFSTVSGNVAVRLPGSLNAAVEMNSMSGELKTDFPIQIVKAEYGPSRRARGTVGTGGESLKMSSVSGNVSLMRMQ